MPRDDSSKKMNHDRPPLTPGRKALMGTLIGIQVVLLAGALAIPEHRDLLWAFFALVVLVSTPMWIRVHELWRDNELF